MVMIFKFLHFIPITTSLMTEGHNEMLVASYNWFTLNDTLTENADLTISNNAHAAS